jgi:flagellar motor protein MotB
VVAVGRQQRRGRRRHHGVVRADRQRRAARVARVIGRADTEPLIADNPADPRNRRISIVLLRDIPQSS